MTWAVFSDEKQSLLDRYRGHNRWDWTSVICLAESLSHFFLSQMDRKVPKWNLPKHLSNVGHLHPTANPGARDTPAHRTATRPSRWAGQGCLPPFGHWTECFSILSTPWCKPSQAVPMTGPQPLHFTAQTLPQRLIPTESHLNLTCFSFHLNY